MSFKQANTYEETTAITNGGGLFGFFLPPLAVLVLGLVLAVIWLSAEPTGSTLAAASGETRGDILQKLGYESNNPNVENSQIPDILSPVFTSEVQYWSGPINTWSLAAGLDPNLVATVMQIESCGNPFAHSGAGAIGLFQVMPYHFAEEDDPYSPDTNALRGLDYLKRSMQAANGDTRLALAGYNGGIGVIGRSESSWAGETQRYAYWGSGIYAEASNGASVSLRLQEWMASNGASLCRQASSRLGISQ